MDLETKQAPPLVICKSSVLFDFCVLLASDSDVEKPEIYRQVFDQVEPLFESIAISLGEVGFSEPRIVKKIAVEAHSFLQSRTYFSNDQYNFVKVFLPGQNAGCNCMCSTMFVLAILECLGYFPNPNVRAGLISGHIYMELKDESGLFHVFECTARLNQAYVPEPEDESSRTGVHWPIFLMSPAQVILATMGPHLPLGEKQDARVLEFVLFHFPTKDSFASPETFAVLVSEFLRHASRVFPSQWTHFNTNRFLIDSILNFPTETLSSYLATAGAEIAHRLLEASLYLNKNQLQEFQPFVAPVTRIHLLPLFFKVLERIPHDPDTVSVVAQGFMFILAWSKWMAHINPFALLFEFEKPEFRLDASQLPALLLLCGFIETHADQIQSDRFAFEHVVCNLYRLLLRVLQVQHFLLDLNNGVTVAVPNFGGGYIVDALTSCFPNLSVTMVPIKEHVKEWKAQGKDLTNFSLNEALALLKRLATFVQTHPETSWLNQAWAPDVREMLDQMEKHFFCHPV